jgi:hypothetical protein
MPIEFQPRDFAASSKCAIDMNDCTKEAVAAMARAVANAVLTQQGGSHHGRFDCLGGAIFRCHLAYCSSVGKPVHMSSVEQRGLVCVIDDDAEVRTSIGSLLRSSGFDIALYESTGAFLAAGIPSVASCLVLDVRLRMRTDWIFRPVSSERGWAFPSS